MASTPDVKLGVWVYCAQHVGPHVSGWCTVGNDQKLGLPAETREEAHEWCRFLKLPLYGYCQVCYERLPSDVPRTCPGKHSTQQVKDAEQRGYALRRYFYYRSSASLVRDKVARVHGIDVDE